MNVWLPTRRPVSIARIRISVMTRASRAGDALDHSLRTVDALPASDPILRMAGLLHDLGKATTAAGGHFIGHGL